MEFRASSGRGKKVMAMMMEKGNVNHTRENPFSRLPDECILEIFSFNPDPSDRWHCATVCKKWLLLQAHMKRSNFKEEPPSQFGPMRRCLEGSHAVDTRLAAMAVRKWAKGIVEDLSIRGDFLEESSCLPPYGITDCGLDIVGSGFPCLRSLSLWGCLHITNKGLVCVSIGCTLLEKLDICECPSITDEGMVAVAKGLEKLTTLSLDTCQKIGNSTLKAFGAYTPTLHSISVKGCPLVGDEGVLAIIEGLPNLKRLRLAQLRSNLQAVPAILMHRKSTLTSLSLEGYSFPKAASMDDSCTIREGQGGGFPESPKRWGYGSIGAFGGECNHLKNITISGCTALNDQELIVLGQRVVGLEKLTLEGCKRVSFSGLGEFLAKHGKNLKALKLVKCSGVVEPRNWLPPSSSPSCSGLESLTVGFCCGLRDGFFGWLGRACGNVREVELIGLPDLSDKGVLGLLMGSGYKRTGSLDRVALNGCGGLTDLSILDLARFFGAELKSLGLSECAGLTSQSLQIIAFYCTELRDLDVSGNALRDRDLVHLERLLWLTNLNLKNCPGLSKTALNSFEGNHFECDLVY
ncbi:unnamed protein product [Victoria cruziana]